MDIIPKVVKKTVRVLTDARPELVSLVGRGANQTGFRVVKSADIQYGALASKGDEDMTYRNGKPPVAEVRTIKFDGEVFRDEEAVKKYLDDHGYINYSIVAKGEGFEVPGGKEDGFEDGSFRDIAIQRGVIYTVGKVKKAEAEDADEEDEDEAEGEEEEAERAAAAVGGTGGKFKDAPKKKSKPKKEKAKDKSGDGIVQKDAQNKLDGTDDDGEEDEEAGSLLMIGDLTADALTQKYDAWFAQFSEGKSVKEVMADGADGLPPGIYEVNDAFYVALRNTLKSGDFKGVAKLATEFGGVIKALAETMSDATVPAEVVERMMASPEEREALDAKATKDAKTKAKKAEAEEAEEDENEDEDAEEQERVQTEKTQTMIADAIAAAMKPLSDAVAEVAKSVDKIGKETKSGLAELEDRVSKSSEEVEKLKKTGSSRKSVEDDGAGAGDPKHKTRKASQDPLVRGALGFQGRPAETF